MFNYLFAYVSVKLFVFYLLLILYLNVRLLHSSICVLVVITFLCFMSKKCFVWNICCFIPFHFFVVMYYLFYVCLFVKLFFSHYVYSSHVSCRGDQTIMNLKGIFKVFSSGMLFSLSKEDRLIGCTNEDTLYLLTNRHEHNTLSFNVHQREDSSQNLVDIELDMNNG